MTSSLPSDREIKASRHAAAALRRTGNIEEYTPSYNPIRNFTYSDETYSTTGRPKYIIDSVSHGRYFSVGGMKLRAEHLKLVFTTILIAVPYSIASSATNLVKSPYHLFRRVDASLNYTLKDRISTAALSIVKAISILVHVILQELAAIYGLIKPVTGRNLYQDLETMRPTCGFQRIDNLELLSQHTIRIK